MFGNVQCSLGYLHNLDVHTGDFDRGFEEVYHSVFCHFFNFETKKTEKTAIEYPYTPPDLHALHDILRPFQGIHPGLII